MKNKNLVFAVGMIFLLLIISNISAEVFLWDSVTKDNSTQIVNYHVYYQFDDTSTTGIGLSQDTPITLVYHVEALPLDLTPDGANFGNIDYCNLTISHTKYIYGTNFVAFEGFSQGELLNTTVETQNIYFGTNASINTGSIVLLLRNRDSVVADMKCHYTTLDGLYENNILGGFLTTYMSSYECSQCVDFSLEQLSNMAEKNQNITANQLSIYTNIQKVVDFNYQIWLILSWVFKIGMIFVAVGLVFAGVYYFYVFFSNIAKELSR